MRIDFKTSVFCRSIMKSFHLILFLCANFVAAVIAYYRNCYDEFSVCLITNTNEPYFSSKFTLTRSLAEDWCKQNSSSLATIANKKVQSAIEAFIADSSAKLETDVITNAYRYYLRSWWWTNLSDVSNNAYSNHYGYGLLVLRHDFFYKFDGQASSERKFICSYTSYNMSCPEEYQQSRSRCYKIHQIIDTWFGARSTCLKEGSDLATFENGVFSAMRNWSLDGEYWIGLQRERWSWINNGPSVDLTYSNWDDDMPSVSGDSCMCVDVENGKWRDCDCSLKYRYICIQDHNSGSRSTLTTTTTVKITSSATPTTTQSTLSTIPSVGGSISQFHSTSTRIREDNFWSNAPDNPESAAQGMRLGLGIGIACLLILIIVIAVFVSIKIRRSRSHDPGPSQGNFATKTIRNDDTPSTVYALVVPNANETEKTPNQTVYAELELAPKGKVSQRTSEPVPSHSGKATSQTVYEELDLVPREKAHGRAVRLPESEYANILHVDSVYANIAHTEL